MILRISLLFLILFVLLVGLQTVVAQNAPPPPVAAKTPESDGAEISDAEMAAKITETLSKPQQWKQYEFAGFEIKTDLPRDAVRQSEAIYDDAFGNANLTMYVSAGDNGVFAVANVAFPYSMTDEKLLRESYEEMAKEFASDPELQFAYSKDFRLDKKLGVEMVGALKDSRFIPARLRLIVLGKTMYLLLAKPGADEGVDLPPSEGERATFESEVARFFNSMITYQKPIVIKPVDKSPVFASRFDAGVYRSEYFQFTIMVPDSWIKVSLEDVEGLRKWGRDFIANSDRAIPATGKRRNLATFASGLLGSKALAMMSINVGVPAVSKGDEMKLAKSLETLVAKVSTYKIVKAPHAVKIGDNEFVGLETTVTANGETQNQIILITRSRSTLLAFTLAYQGEADRAKLLAAIATLKFAKK